MTEGVVPILARDPLEHRTTERRVVPAHTLGGPADATGGLSPRSNAPTLHPKHGPNGHGSGAFEQA